MYLAREPSVLSTILGSCVSVTFWSQKLSIGALCHAMLPHCPETKSDAERLANRWQYVDFCIRDLARQFDSLGVQRRDVQVKVFGGADVLYVGEDDLRPTVGKQNCDTALKVLDEENFVVLAADIGQTFGRKIRFNTASGRVLLARLT
jgi:chemotaxis protein CheD